MSESAIASLNDGIRYMRGGSPERAWNCFEAAARDAEDPSVQSEALRRQADLKRRRAEWPEALRLSAAARQVAEDNALPDLAAAALNIEGTVHLQRGDFETALEVYKDALSAGPDPHQRGLICQNIGTTYAQQDRHMEAAEWYENSSAAFRLAGCPREQILALINQGNVHLDLGDAETAEIIFRDALGHLDAFPMGDAELQALVEINLAEALARQESRLEDAFSYLISATGHFSVSENRPHRVACHRVFALISELQGKIDLAIGALKQGAALAVEIESAPEIAYFQRELGRLEVTLIAPTLEPENTI
jgi:tetratricopeptide (TPR) repeat protein